MSKPTAGNKQNAIQYIVDAEWEIEEFIEYLEEEDPADFRKYWGHMDIPDIKTWLESPEAVAALEARKEEI